MSRWCRIDAKGLSPLPVADGYAEIGSWVGAPGHPGDDYYLFTQGFVTRYSTEQERRPARAVDGPDRRVRGRFHPAARCSTSTARWSAWRP